MFKKPNKEKNKITQPQINLLYSEVHKCTFLVLIVSSDIVPFLLPQARRYKRKGKLGCSNGSAPVINPGENALSIPQITYDHVDEQEDKDVSFFIGEPRGNLPFLMFRCAFFKRQC